MGTFSSRACSVSAIEPECIARKDKNLIINNNHHHLCAPATLRSFQCALMRLMCAYFCPRTLLWGVRGPQVGRNVRVSSRGDLRRTGEPRDSAHIKAALEQSYSFQVRGFKCFQTRCRCICITHGARAHTHTHTYRRAAVKTSSRRLLTLRWSPCCLLRS